MDFNLLLILGLFVVIIVLMTITILICTQYAEKSGRIKKELLRTKEEEVRYQYELMKAIYERGNGLFQNLYTVICKIMQEGKLTEEEEREIKRNYMKISPFFFFNNSLEQAFEFLVKEIKERTKADIYMSTKRYIKLCEKAEISIFRVSEYLLNEIVLKTEPNRIDIHIYTKQDEIVLEITDNGTPSHLDQYLQHRKSEKAVNLLSRIDFRIMDRSTIDYENKEGINHIRLVIKEKALPLSPAMLHQVDRV